MSHFFKQLTSHAISTMLLNKCEDVYSTVHKSVTVIYETFAWNGAQYAKEKCVRWICSQVNIVLFTYSVLWLSSPLLWPEDVRKKKKQGMAQLWLNLHLMAVGVEGCTAPGPRHDQHEISWMENISSSRSVMTSFQTKQPRGQIASVLLSYINVDFFFSPTVGCCYADCPVAPHWTPRLILPGS